MARVAGAVLMPLETLGRPRIDVVATLSGIFRDLLPLQTKLLAEAALLAATADEPVEQNFVRMHALAFQAEHGGSIEDAALRVFGNADGAYGANVNQLDRQRDLERRRRTRRRVPEAQGFCLRCFRTPRRHDAVLSHALAQVDVTYQNLEFLGDGRHHCRPLFRYAWLA